MVRVGSQFDQALVFLQETNIFYLKPNKPELSVRFQGEDSLYKASVEGTMVSLFGCDARGANCELLDQGGTKSSDLLSVDEWNLVKVDYINGDITVDINMMTNVMGKNMMPMAKGKGGGGGGDYVTFVVPPRSPFYDATLKIECDDPGRPPYIKIEPLAVPTSPAPRTSLPLDSMAFPECPVYRVEADHPTHPSGVPVSESFTFVVFPNHPALHMEIVIGRVNIKLWVNGTRGAMQKCNLMNRQCNLEDEAFGAHNILEPGTWNEVTVYLEEDTKMLIMKVNNTELLSSFLGTGNYRSLDVVVKAPQGPTYEGGEHFVAFVNVRCVGGQHIIHPGTVQTPTQGGLPTKDSIVETTTPAAPSGVSRNIGIVVGVLLGVLLVIAIAVIITYRKRRVAPINEQSPLQNQQQQKK